MHCYLGFEVDFYGFDAWGVKFEEFYFGCYAVVGGEGIDVVVEVGASLWVCGVGLEVFFGVGTQVVFEWVFFVWGAFLSSAGFLSFCHATILKVRVQR